MDAENRQISIDLLQDVSSAATDDIIQEKLLLLPKDKKWQVLTQPVDGTTILRSLISEDRDVIIDSVFKTKEDLQHYGSEMLLLAVSKNAYKTVKVLLSKGVSVLQYTEGHKTCLHIAAELGHTKIVKLLLVFGATEILNITEDTGCTALTFACMKGREDITGLLIANGAAINMTVGLPPLHAASLMGHGNIVNILLEKGADVKLQDTSGFTALHFAAFKGHGKVIKILLAAGSDPNIQDAQGKKAIELTKSEAVYKLLAAT